MKLLSLSKNCPAPAAAKATTTTLARSSSWPWEAYCHRPKTLSFHRSDNHFISANSPSRSQKEEDDDCEDREEDDSIETVIQGARLEGRLFIEPAGETSSVLAVEPHDGSAGEGARAQEPAAADGVAMCVVESRNPCEDFRMSMEEMVEAHALRDRWDSLADLLRCYLRVNDRTNHEHILRAFVDLLLSSGPRRTRSAFTGGSSCSRRRNDTDNTVSSDADVNINPPSTTSSPCSPLSFYTSSSSCCSSSDSVSTTPCCISVTGDAQENGSGGGGSVGQGRLPLSLKVVVTEQNNGGDDSSSSTTTSSSSDA